MQTPTRPERTMSRNLFVTFDLRDSLRQAPLILSAIEELGQATRLFSSTWYVRSNLAAAEAARRVWDVMDRADSLVVIDTSSDEVAMFNLNDRCERFMSHCWHQSLDVQPSNDKAAVPEAAPHAREIRSAVGLG
jgi:hypothetical protein